MSVSVPQLPRIQAAEKKILNKAKHKPVCFFDFFKTAIINGINSEKYSDDLTIDIDIVIDILINNRFYYKGVL